MLWAVETKTVSWKSLKHSVGVKETADKILCSFFHYKLDFLHYTHVILSIVDIKILLSAALIWVVLWLQRPGLGRNLITDLLHVNMDFKVGRLLQYIMNVIWTYFFQQYKYIIHSIYIKSEVDLPDRLLMQPLSALAALPLCVWGSMQRARTKVWCSHVCFKVFVCSMCFSCACCVYLLDR